MCGHKRHKLAETERQAYEGETMRLDGSQTEATFRRRDERWPHFPWWTLWLIWPLVMLVKWLIITSAGAASILSTLLTQPIRFEISLLPLALIAIGLLLVLRRRHG